MFADLVQMGVRTVYRTLGAREVRFDREGASIGGFAFEHAPGDPLVLLHGLGDASTTWFRVMGDLREDRPVYALDIPPFGTSELSQGHAVPPREHARFVAELIQEEGADPVTLVGHSLGGWVGMWFALDYPDLVDRLVLISPAGAPLPGSIEALSTLRPSSLEATREYLATLWHQEPYGMDLMVRETMERLHGPEISGFLDGLNPGDGLEPRALGRIRTPALVIWGCQDRLLDERTPAYLAKHWGGPVERDYLARAAHMVHQERPRRVVARIRDVAGIPSQGST